MPQVELDYSRCEGAGKCLNVCRHGVWEWIEIDGRRLPYPANQGSCTACKSCEAICPSKAVEVLP